LNIVEWFIELFGSVFLDVFVEFATEVGAAVVTGGFGSATVGQTSWECDAAEVAFVGGGACASAGWRQGDVTDLTAFEGAFAFGCERWKRVMAVEAMFLKDLG
jgi:hypothetical protein